jgi:SNF2 family DNA or RNA helicase
MRIERAGSRIQCEVGYIEKDLVKAVPGARWGGQEDKNHWYVPLAWTACKALRAVFGDKLEVGPQLAAWAAEQQRWMQPALKLRTALTQDDALEAMPGAIHVSLNKLGLYPHQEVDVGFLAVSKRALLAHEMGCGKTPSAVSAMCILDRLGRDTLPALVVCPNSMKLTWSREIRRWFPEAEPVVLGRVLKKGTWKAASSAERCKQIAELPENGVLISNFEVLRRHTRLAPYGSVALNRCKKCGGQSEVRETNCETHLRELNEVNFATVIIDEAHRMKDPKAKQTRAIWAAAPEANYRWALTGTPITNHPGDLWSILHLIAPEEWPARSRYVDRFALISYNPFGGLDIVGVRPDTAEEFFAGVDPHFRRVTKAEVLKFLPPKVRESRYAEMSAKQAKAYTDMDDEMITKLEDGGVIIATNTLTEATRKLQFSSAYCTVNDANEIVLSEPSNKLDALEEILEDLGDKPVVVAALSRQLIALAGKRLEKRGISHAFIVGGLSDEERQAAIDRFQAGQVRVMLMTLQAGGVGITLTRADTMIFLQRSWSMVDNVQAEARIHRIGSEQHSVITVIDVIAPDTVEEDQIDAVHEKFARLEQITRDEDRIALAREMDS